MTGDAVDPILARLRALAAFWPEWRELDLAAPDWKKNRKASDWRAYIDDDMRAFWPQLTERERLIAFLVAQEACLNENWE